MQFVDSIREDHVGSLFVEQLEIGKAARKAVGEMDIILGWLQDAEQKSLSWLVPRFGATPTMSGSYIPPRVKVFSNDHSESYAFLSFFKLFNVFVIWYL